MNYYNENDPKAAAWLRELIKAGVIAHGEVDERSILEIKPAELKDYVQCHFFAGIGGWSYALRLAGWNDDRPVWTGSCPCQPFSDAGKGLAEKDERHLWPVWRELIRARHPATIFGEQVASKAGRKWLAGVFADVEAMEYQRAGADLCAASVRAPQRRQRLFWMAYAKHAGCNRPQTASTVENGDRANKWLHHGGSAKRMANSEQSGRKGRLRRREDSQRQDQQRHAGRIGTTSSVADSELDRRAARSGNERSEDEKRTPSRSNADRCCGEHRGLGDAESGRCGVERDASLATSGRHIERADWSRFDIVQCRDGKARRFEPESFPLDYGIPDRVALLRGYGNAIVSQVAAEFIIACEEALQIER